MRTQNSDGLRIALYQPWIYVHGGLERSLLELVSRSRHQWTIFTGHYDPDGTFPEFRRHDVRPLKPLSVKRDMLSVLKVACRVATQKIPQADFDAFVVWCDGIGDMATFRNRSLPTFNICSTPLRAAFDPVYQAQALQSRGRLARLAFQVFRRCFRSVDRLAWKNYDGVVATSQEVRERIVDGRLHPGDDSMVLYHPGIDWGEFSGATGYEPYLLVPGRIMWTKNIQLAIEAFKQADLPQPWKLVVAGYVDDKSRGYLAELRQLAEGRAQIEFVCNPTDDQLKALYGGASAVLFTPLNEDWGIVPLEGMAFSKVVLANNRGGPKESVLDGRTGWLLEPQVDAWAERIKTLPELRDELATMGAYAREHVRRYDWSVFVSGVDDAIESWTLNSGKRRRVRDDRNALRQGGTP